MEVWEAFCDVEHRRLVNALSGDTFFGERQLDAMLAELRVIRKLRGHAQSAMDAGQIAERELREDGEGE